VRPADRVGVQSSSHSFSASMDFTVPSLPPRQLGGNAPLRARTCKYMLTVSFVYGTGRIYTQYRCSDTPFFSLFICCMFEWRERKRARSSHASPRVGTERVINPPSNLSLTLDNRGRYLEPDSRPVRFSTVRYFSPDPYTRH
jgi:hypothetical protein